MVCHLFGSDLSEELWNSNPGGVLVACHLFGLGLSVSPLGSLDTAVSSGVVVAVAGASTGQGSSYVSRAASPLGVGRALFGA